MKRFCKKNSKQAFSLIELSIVIVIVSILITGALSVSVNAINSSKNKVTKDRIAEVYKALGNYLLINKKLPCPAPITDTKSGTSTYGTATSVASCASTAGVSQSSTSTNLMRGMLPVKTLGLPLDMAEDGFGNKFEYIVDKDYTIASAQTTVVSGVGDFGNSTTANITINEKPGSSAIAVESAAVLAIISLGANKSGAYAADSSSRNALSTDAEEIYNLPTSTSDGTLYTNTLYSSSGNSDVFDDVVFYKTRNNFALDFNALSLIPCMTTTQALYGGTMTWPNAWYDKIVAATSVTCSSLGYSNGPTEPTIRCGAFGVWDTSVTAPCVQ